SGTPDSPSIGVYHLVMHSENCAGTKYDQNFTLTVVGDCVQAPTGMIDWWPGDGSAIDIAGQHNGALNGDAGFGDGKVGKTFTFDGTGDYVDVGDVDLPVPFTFD